MITTLLIVDSSELDRRRYWQYLSRRPETYLILEAGNEEEAKELCKSQKPDAILMGLSLSEDSAANFLNWLHNQSYGDLLPVLLLTNQKNENAAAQFASRGIQDYLIKEYLTAPRLIHSLDYLLERMRLINTVSEAIQLRKRAEESIAESSERLYSLVECSNDLIWSTDLEGDFTYLSPQFKVIFGWEPLSWIGKPMLDLVHIGDRLRFKKNIDQILHDHQKHSFSIKVRQHKNDGSCIWVSSNVIGIRSRTGEVIAVQGILRDISDRIALAHAIRDRKLAQSRLYEFNHTLTRVHQDLIQSKWNKNEFLSNMSYEVRTSLEIIVGLVESLQSDAYSPFNKKKCRSLQSNESSERHLLDLINDILDFSKVDVGSIL
jgi:PAS domain S-box-containing protein